METVNYIPYMKEDGLFYWQKAMLNFTTTALKWYGSGFGKFLYKTIQFQLLLYKSINE